MKSDKSRQRQTKIIKRSVTAFAVLFGIVGILVYFRMSQQLNKYMEQQVVLHTQQLADNYSEKLQLELEELNTYAAQIVDMPQMAESILNKVTSKQKGVTMGVLQIDGTAVYGDYQDIGSFPNFQDAFRGNEVISYSKGKGMLFAVPIYNGSNVRYVIYKLYAEDVLVDYFGVDSYQGEGRAALVNYDDTIIVPFADGTNIAKYMSDPSVQKGREIIREALNVSTAAATLCEVDGKECFEFKAELAQEQLYIVGLVDKSVVSKGVETMVTLVIWVFGLLLILFIIGIAYILLTESKVQESEELREAKLVAEQANRAKSDFLASMSHEIRTPINAVMGMNEMILRESEDEDILGYANDIQNASHTLLSLINDILDFSKIEAGKMEIVESPYQVSALLNDVVNMISIKATQKDLELITDIDENLPSVLQGDEVRIRQIAVNILSNAVKYTERGHVRFVLKSQQKDDEMFLVLEVSDTGIGIKEEDLQKLFEGFERLDIQKNHAVEGTGLGLAITKKLTEQMGGTLNVSSVYGKGSTFTVILPQEVVDATPLGNFKERYEEFKKQQQKYKEKYTAPEARVLVVDDNRMNRKVVEGLLKKTKIMLDEADSGMAALAMMEKQKYDVILLDHMMPEMDGVETLHRLHALEKNYNKETPVIALTANAIVGVKEMYLKEGFADYLAKPITGMALEDMLADYLPKEKLIWGKTEDVEDKKITPSEKMKNIDIALGMEYCYDDEDMFRQMLLIYCEEASEKMTDIASFYEQCDWDNYRIKVHALKSTSLNIGAADLSEQAKALEFASKDILEGKADDAYIKAHHAEVMELYKATVEEAGIYLEKKGKLQ